MLPSLKDILLMWFLASTPGEIFHEYPVLGIVDDLEVSKPN
jgi:hypothetical protein